MSTGELWAKLPGVGKETSFPSCPSGCLSGVSRATGQEWKEASGGSEACVCSSLHPFPSSCMRATCHRACHATCSRGRSRSFLHLLRYGSACGVWGRIVEPHPLLPSPHTLSTALGQRGSFGSSRFIFGAASSRKPLLRAKIHSSFNTSKFVPKSLEVPQALA